MLMEGILFTTKKGNVATDTRRVAQALGLPHEQVLQAFDALECSPDFSRLNFVSMVDDSQQVVVMSRAGFMRLLMDLPGATASAMLQQVIVEFDRMEAELRQARSGPTAAEATQSLTEQLIGASPEQAMAFREQVTATYQAIMNLGFGISLPELKA